MNSWNPRSVFPTLARSSLLVFLMWLAAGWSIQAALQQGKTPAKKSVIPFIENDYSKALADARERNVLLFVDAWASW